MNAARSCRGHGNKQIPRGEASLEQRSIIGYIQLAWKSANKRLTWGDRQESSPERKIKKIWKSKPKYDNESMIERCYPAGLQSRGIFPAWDQLENRLIMFQPTWIASENMHSNQWVGRKERKDQEELAESTVGVCVRTNPTVASLPGHDVVRINWTYFLNVLVRIVISWLPKVHGRCWPQHL